VQEEVRGAAGGARPPQGPPSNGGPPGVRVQPCHRVHVAGAAEEEGGAHVQEDQADRVVRAPGDGLRREGEAAEDHRRQDQGADAVAKCGRGVCSGCLARERHL